MYSHERMQRFYRKLLKLDKSISMLKARLSIKSGKMSKEPEAHVTLISEQA